MACHRDQGSENSIPGKHGVRYKFSRKRSPLAPLYSCGADAPQTVKQLYQRSSCTVLKVLRTTTDFPTWGSGKGTENLQGIGVWRPVGFYYRTYTRLGKQTLAGHKENLVHTRSQKKRTASPQEIVPELPVSNQKSLVEAWVDSGLLQRQGH